MLGCNNPPLLPTLKAYPTSTLGGTPNFDHENERKGSKIDYLKAQGQLLLFLFVCFFHFYEAVKKNSRGLQHPPPG